MRVLQWQRAPSLCERLPVVLTARLIHVHEDQVLVGSQDGVELLVSNGGELGHVPALPLVQGDVDAPRGPLRSQSIVILAHPHRDEGTSTRGGQGGQAPSLS